jgi:glycosyltransferase involved in cell wall biosynthesis
MSDVTVLSTAHDVADARLHRIVGALAAAGLTVDVVGLGGAGAAPPEAAAVRTRVRSGPLRRAWWALTLPVRVRGRVLVAFDPDLYWPALVWGRLRRRAVVVDVQEDYAALLEDRDWARGPLGWAARRLARAAVAAARRADLCVVADDHLPPRKARRRLVVRNLPIVDHLPAPGEPGAVPRALYIGDLRVSRGLRTMVEAVMASPPWTLDLVGPISAADAAWVHGHTDHRIRLHGRLPPRQAWRLAEGAWVGLALLEPTPAFTEAVPTKLYEYLAAGLAVVTSDLPRMAQLVYVSGAGTVARDAAEAAEALQHWRDHPGVLAEHRAAARRWADANLTGASPYDELASAVSGLVGKT